MLRESSDQIAGDAVFFAAITGWALHMWLNCHHFYLSTKEMLEWWPLPAVRLGKQPRGLTLGDTGS